MLSHEIYTVKLLEKKLISPNTCAFTFSKPPVSWPEGTNFHLAFADYKDHEKKKYVRHFSVVNLDHEDHITFITRHTPSPFKERLFKLKTNDTMLLYGLKQRMPLRLEDRPITLVSMGVGLAAFRTAILTHQKMGSHLPLKQINISKQEDLFKGDFEGLKNVKNYYLFARSDLMACLEETYDQASIYYIVGSDDFIDGLLSFLHKKNHKPSLIEMDKKADKKSKLLNQFPID